MSELPAVSGAAPILPAASRVERVELLISTLLRLGVIISAALIAAGTVITLIHHPAYLTSSSALAGLKGGRIAFPVTPVEIGRGLRQFQGNAIAATGLATLVATPIMRVAVSIVIFALMKDRIFTIVTFAVLVFLLGSLVLGKAGG